jgi:replication factor C small subunit
VTYDKQVVIKLIEKFFRDYRRTLNELQRYSSSGNIDAGTLAQVSDVKRLGDLIAHLKNRNFSDMRKWVVMNSDIDTNRIYRRIYDGLSRLSEAMKASTGYYHHC